MPDLNAALVQQFLNVSVAVKRLYASKRLLGTDLPKTGAALDKKFGRKRWYNQTACWMIVIRKRPGSESVTVCSPAPAQ